MRPAGTGSSVPRLRWSSSLDALPLGLTSFVGREREIAEIKRLLSERRLLTLCGPGGSGKTRLALAVAQAIAEGFEGGARWVELAPISDPEIVPAAVAQAVGAREAPDLSPTEALVEHLKPRRVFLILDCSGATGCWASPNGRCSDVSRCSREGGIWRRPGRLDRQSR